MSNQPLIAVIMGSESDMEVMSKGVECLKKLKVPFELDIISAHRTPDKMFDYASNLFDRNFAAVIAGAGGAAHLPGMVASLSTLPVIGVPIESKKLKGLDSLLSIAQMPQGCPVATMAINGSKNAGLLAASIIGNFDEKIKSNLEKWKRLQTKSIKKKP